MKMNQEKQKLFKQFSTEVWLYLDGDLPEDRVKFWDQKLKEIPELQNYLNDYDDISQSYNKQEIIIDEDKFNLMIDKSIKTTVLSSKIKSFISNLLSTEKEFAFGKIAFASVLIIGAITISIISNRPIPVLTATENLSSEILAWDADFVDNQISRVSNLLKVAEDEEYRKYYKYKKSSPNVDKNINLINNSIKELKSDIKNQKL